MFSLSKLKRHFHKAEDQDSLLHHLPAEINVEIFSYLPMSESAKAALTCALFNNLHNENARQFLRKATPDIKDAIECISNKNIKNRVLKFFSKEPDYLSIALSYFTLGAIDKGRKSLHDYYKTYYSRCNHISNEKHLKTELRKYGCFSYDGITIESAVIQRAFLDHIDDIINQAKKNNNKDKSYKILRMESILFVAQCADRNLHHDHLKDHKKIQIIIKRVMKTITKETYAKCYFWLSKHKRHVDAYLISNLCLYVYDNKPSVSKLFKNTENKVSYVKKQ
jgi:hypothetical protein